MRSKKIIAIIGPDGAGKTLLAKYLYYITRKRGKSVHLIYCGWRSFNNIFALILKGFFALRFHKKVGTEQYTSIRLKRALIKNVAVKNLFKFFVLIDYCVTTVPKLIIFSFSEDIIILDRYFTDLLVNMSIDLKENAKSLIITYKFMKSIMPKPTLTFLLLTKPEVLFTRKADIPTLNFSIQQCRRFNYIRAFDPNIIVIDASEKIYSEVEKILSKMDAS